MVADGIGGGGALAAAPAAGAGVVPAAVGERAPAAVAAAVRACVRPGRLTFPAGGGYRRIDGWEPAPIRDAAVLEQARERLRDLAAATAPADEDWLACAVAALLSHYRPDGARPEVEAQVAADWVDDLAGFPAWAVAEAARRWRTTRRFRPQVSEVAASCRELAGEAVWERDRLASLVAASDGGVGEAGRGRAGDCAGVARGLAASLRAP